MEKKNKKITKPEAVKKVKDSSLEYKTLEIGESEYKTLFSKKYENRKQYSPPDPKKILSVIPGTIISVLAKANQKIEPGEAIIILEAMKMMNRIILPLGGTIKKIYVKEGEKIPKKHLIAELK